MRALLSLVLFLALIPAVFAQARDPDPRDWRAVVDAARGQTVYWHAWGGSEQINAYIQWVADAVEARFGIRLVHVKVDDTAHAVATVLAEKQAGRTEGGTIDLLWINGENFAAMKQADLLLPFPWAEDLPNWQWVDVEGKPTVRNDFTVPVEGLESPWGMARLVFFHDSARTPPAEMPASAAELLDWAGQNPGRFAYPKPPDFIGTSFLKQVLIELTPDAAVLARPAEEADFAAATAPLFAYLDRLHPDLWRAGRAFPANYPALKQMLADGEVEIIFAFNPGEASAAIVSGELPDSVRSFVFPAGTLGNTHFVAIPFNSSARAGAMVVADFLLSPEAQARKQDPVHWGDPTVLDVARLPPDARALFDRIDLGIATLPPDALGPVLAEPHPSWTERLEAEWQRRYGVAE